MLAFANFIFFVLNALAAIAGVADGSAPVFPVTNAFVAGLNLMGFLALIATRDA